MLVPQNALKGLPRSEKNGISLSSRNDASIDFSDQITEDAEGAERCALVLESLNYFRRYFGDRRQNTLARCESCVTIATLFSEQVTLLLESGPEMSHASARFSNEVKHAAMFALLDLSFLCIERNETSNCDHFQGENFVLPCLEVRNLRQMINSPTSDDNLKDGSAQLISAYCLTMPERLGLRPSVDGSEAHSEFRATLESLQHLLVHPEKIVCKSAVSAIVNLCAAAKQSNNLHEALIEQPWHRYLFALNLVGAVSVESKISELHYTCWLLQQGPSWISEEINAEDSITTLLRTLSSCFSTNFLAVESTASNLLKARIVLLSELIKVREMNGIKKINLGIFPVLKKIHTAALERDLESIKKTSSPCEITSRKANISNWLVLREYASAMIHIRGVLEQNVASWSEEEQIQSAIHNAEDKNC
jgi:hypothetical protein